MTIVLYTDRALESRRICPSIGNWHWISAEDGSCGQQAPRTGQLAPMVSPAASQHPRGGTSTGWRLLGPEAPHG